MDANPRAVEAAPHSPPDSAAGESGCFALGLEPDRADRSSQTRECPDIEAVADALGERVDRRVVHVEWDGLGRNPAG